MLSVKEYIQLVEGGLKKYIPDEVNNGPANLYNPVLYTLESGGKRIRATLLLMAANLFTDDLGKVIPASVAIEVFHNFTLLHDDIMDNADIRRGKATVHKKWDANTAILSGDAMIILAWKLLSKSDQTYLKETLSEFNKVAIEVCEGQQLDIDLEKAYLDDDDVNVENYLEMIRLKTSVLLASALKIGAIQGGANAEIAESLYEFGQNLGLAFQLQDDYLDSFGDQKTFGKKIGGDIIEGKKTFLTTKTKEMADSLVWNDFLNIISSNSIPEDEKISKVQDLYTNIGAKEATVQLAEEYFSKASAVLEALPVDEKNKNSLREILLMLNKREY